MEGLCKSIWVMKVLSEAREGKALAQEGTHMYRGSDAVLGGVCSGIAEYFDFDVALMRILVLVLTVISAGAFAFVYLAVWLILPAQAGQENTVDVDPTTFRSEVYEQVVNSTAQPSQNVYTAIPPVPPASAAAYYQNSARASYAHTQVPPTSMGTHAPKPAQAPSKPLSVGLAAGVLIICVALIALSSVLGIFTVDVNAWVTQAGPFLLIAVGLFIMGRASKTNILLVFAGFALVVFLVVGAFFSLQEGPTELGASLPFNPDSIMEQR